METTTLDSQLVQGIIRGLYRLFRVAALHALDNDAVDIAVSSTLEALRGLQAFESAGITLIVTEDTAIVNGQLLRAPPDIYEDAMDFSRFLGKVGVNSITIAKSVTEDGLRALLRLFTDRTDPSRHLGADGRLTQHIRLQLVNPNLLLGLEDERLGQLERVLLTYALSVLVLRRLFASIEQGSYEIAGYFKRMARQLSLVNYADRPMVFDVIVGHHLEPDVAKLAVNSAILSVAMTRRFTDDETALMRVCMGALLLDVGRHRPATTAHGEGTEALPLSTAVVQMAMGALRGDSVERTIITYEAQSLLDGVDPGLVFPDAGAPSFDAYVIATARRFVELVTGSGTGNALTTDDAIQVLHARAPDDLSHYCVDLLTDAIGLIPRGTCVELDSGFRGVVARSGPRPSDYECPTVRVIEGPRGERVPPRDVVLHEDSPESREHRRVSRVLHAPGPLLLQLQKELAGGELDWISRRKESERRVRAWLEREAALRHAGGVIETRRGTSSQQAVVPATSTPVDARTRAMGWSVSESGAFAAVGDDIVATPRTGASAEFERRSQGPRVPVTGGFDAITTGDFAVVATSAAAPPRADDARVPEAGITMRPVSGSRQAAPPTGVYRRARSRSETLEAEAAAASDSQLGGRSRSRSESRSASSLGEAAEGGRRKSIREYLTEVRARSESLSGDRGWESSFGRQAVSASVSGLGSAAAATEERPVVETPIEGAGILRRTGSRKAVPESEPEFEQAGILRRTGSRKAVSSEEGTDD